MNLSIHFAPKTVLDNIASSFSTISRVIKSDAQSILLAVIIITLLGTINHQDYECSYYADLPNYTLKKTPLFLNEKNLVVQNLLSRNSKQAERTELMKSQIETALFFQESQ